MVRRSPSLTDKEALKAKLDEALLPFRVAAAAWSGGVMLGPEKCDDLAYAQLLKAIGDSGRIPGTIESESLRDQIARGLGLDTVPEEREVLRPPSARPGDSCAWLRHDLPGGILSASRFHTGNKGFTPYLGIRHGMPCGQMRRSSWHGSTSAFWRTLRNTQGTGGSREENAWPSRA